MIRFEFKKMVNKTNVVIVMLFFLFFLGYSFLILRSGRPYLNQKGEIKYAFSGMKEKALEEKELSLILSEKNLMNRHERFDGSIQKKMLLSDSNLLNREAVSFGQEALNLLINFTEKVENTNATDVFLKKPKEGLKDFYSEWKKAGLRYSKSYNGYRKEEITKIDSLYKKVRTPFYYEGTLLFELFISVYRKTYPFFFVFIILCLSDAYRKKAMSGVDEISLISKSGKDKFMFSKAISRLLFIALLFSIYYFCILLMSAFINGGVNGWKTSIQLYESASIFSVTLGEAIVILYFTGLTGVLLISQIILLISMISKNLKFTLSVSSFFLLWLYQFTGNYDVNMVEKKKLFLIRLNPLRYVNTMDLFFGSVHYFPFGNPLPYAGIIVIGFILFSSFHFFLIRLLGKRYFMG